jgi:hypothetical protein
MPAPNGNIHAYNGTRGGKDSDQDDADKGKGRGHLQRCVSTRSRSCGADKSVMVSARASRINEKSVMVDVRGGMRRDGSSGSVSVSVTAGQNTRKVRRTWAEDGGWW